jgi:hypothetical protein
MKSLRIVPIAFLAALGCGDGSAKHVDSSAGGSGGTAGSGSGGALANATGGSSATSGNAGGSGSDASVSGIADASAVDGTCPKVANAPCGGDVIGTWTLKFDECVFPSGSPSYCPGLTFSIDPASNYGATYTFNANTAFSASIGGKVASTTRYPPSCLNGDAGAAEACAQLSTLLQTTAPKLGDAGTDNISSASYSCSSDPGGTCVCDSRITYISRTVAGNYTTSGTKLTITALGGNDAGVLEQGADGPTDYCVSGNTLTLWPTDPSSTSKPAVLTR